MGFCYIAHNTIHMKPYREERRIARKAQWVRTFSGKTREAGYVFMHTFHEKNTIAPGGLAAKGVDLHH